MSCLQRGGTRQNSVTNSRVSEVGIQDYGGHGCSLLMLVSALSLCTPYRPDLSQRSQAVEVNFGVDCRCIRISMSKHLSNLPHRRQCPLSSQPTLWGFHANEQPACVARRAISPKI